jgi:hypothetical protein
VSAGAGKLTVADIADLRAYERERDGFRARIIELKKRRRVAVGPVITFVFENRETVRFQVQEMARAERITSDDAIQVELDIYNPLVPGPGELAATMFIELTSDEDLRQWLPKLVGVERAVELRLAGTDGGLPEVIPAVLDPAHAEQLTRDDITASVHYLGWTLAPDQVERFAAGPVELAVEHPSYAEAATLGEMTRNELLGDLRGPGADRQEADS